jgi:Domain of unknown function (DUF4397)
MAKNEIDFRQILGVCFLLFLSGCLGKSEDQVVNPPSTTIAFFNASPNSSEMDVYLNDSKLSSSFSYKAYSNYLPITPPGLKKVKFTSDATSAILIDTTFTFAEKLAYTVVVANKVSGTPQAILVEDKATLSNTQNTMIRFAHMSPDTPAVDVKLVGGISTILSTGQTYTNFSTFTEFETRTYSVEIRRSSDSKLLLTVVVPLSSAGTFQTVYLLGYSAPPGGNLNTLSSKITN